MPATTARVAAGVMREATSRASRSRIVGSFQENGASVAAGARNPTIHRPPRPARRAGRARRPGRQPALVLAPARPRTSSEPSTPTLWESTGRDPVRLLGAVGRERLDELAGDDGFLERLGAAQRRPRRATSPATAGTSARPATGRARRAIALLLARVRHHRGAAAVLRRPRHPRRRPPQGRQRPRRPDRRRRPALPARLLQAVAVPRGLAAGDLPGPRPRRAAAVAAARGRRLAARRSSIALPGGPTLRRPDLGRQRRPGAAAAARLRRRGATPTTTATSPTGCTAATASTGCARSCCSASAASARCAPTPGSPAHPAPEVFHTNEGHAGFLGLERIRELTVAEDGPRLDFDTALEVGRAGTVFTTHTPVPAGIDRFPRDAGRAVLRRRRRRPPACRSTGSSRSAPRTTRAATPAVFNMAVMGFRLAQRANGVSQLHGHGQPRHVQRPVAGLRRGRGADRLDHQRRARPDLGRPRGLRARRRARAPTPTPTTPTASGPPSTRSPAPTSGRSSGCCASGSSTTPARRLRESWQQARRRPGRARLDRQRARPRRADDRLRPPRAVVQAADADAARPRAAQARCCCTPSGRSSWSSPARRTRPTTAARS